MKIFVKVKPNSKKESVEKIDPLSLGLPLSHKASDGRVGRASDTHFSVSVKEPPHEGRANEALVKILAGYFGIAASRIKIIAGRKSRQKIVEIK